MSSIIDKAKSALNLDSSSSSITLTGQKIGSTGYGLMGLTWRASPPSQSQSFEAMRTALSSGANFWNGGEIYGNPERNSLQLLNEYFTQYPSDADKVVLSIKGGCVRGELKPDGSAENTRRSIEECLRVLDGKKKLNIWESARVDSNTPIEVTMREAKKFVDAGKIDGIGLSECSATTIRRAAKITKIAAVEVEYSMFSTEILTNGVAKACAELDIPIVAYSPLGRGFLTGQVRKPEDIPEGDLRKHFPQYQPGAFEQNMKLVEEVEGIAKRKGRTPGQVAVAWLKAQGKKEGMPVVVPIPGATTKERGEENVVHIELDEHDLKEIDSILENVKVAGARYPEMASHNLFGDTPEEN